MHVTMMLRILDRMEPEQLAARVMDENLPESDREQALALLDRRGLLPRRRRPRQRAWNRA